MSKCHDYEISHLVLDKGVLMYVILKRLREKGRLKRI